MYLLQLPLATIFLVSLVCAENTYYTIWPKDSADKETNHKITDDLNKRIGEDNIYASQSATIGYLFWNQQLSEDDLKHYREFPGVSILFDS